MHEAVDGYGALASCRDGVDHELLTRAGIAAHEDVRLAGLEGDGVRLDGAVAVEFHLRAFEQRAPVGLLADAEQHVRAFRGLRDPVIELRVESAFGVLDRQALAERDARRFAFGVLEDLRLTPARVDADAFFLAFSAVVRSHGHLVVAFEAVQVDALGAGSQSRSGHVRRDVAAADDDGLSGEAYRLVLVDLPGEFDAGAHAFGVFPRNAHFAAALQAGRDIEGLEALVAQLLQGHVPADFHAAADLDAHLLDDADLAFDNFLLQAEVGDAVHHHAAGALFAIEDRDGIAFHA